MINSYIRHKFQFPVTDLTREIDKKIKILFGSKAADYTEDELARLATEAEHQIELLFKKYGDLIK